MAIFDTLRGLYHFLGDRVPKGLEAVPPRPRKQNLWRREGTALVSKVGVSDLEASLAKAIDLLGGLDKLVSTGDRVMVKPNFNSPDPPPGSTDLVFLQAVIELLKQVGARVQVGESSGALWRPTRVTLGKVSLPELLAKLGVELVIFEDRPRDWVRVKIEGDYLRWTMMPRSAYEADKLVYLPCLKTHSLARFSGAIKLSAGFTHPGQRRFHHRGKLEEKLAEINLAWQPDLIIMDGRKAFVSGGPTRGEVAEPGLIMASGDIVALDVEALKVLLSYKGRNRLPADPWQLPQIATALKHGLGTREYRVVTEAEADRS